MYCYVETRHKVKNMLKEPFSFIPTELSNRSSLLPHIIHITTSFINICILFLRVRLDTKNIGTHSSNNVLVYSRVGKGNSLFEGSVFLRTLNTIFAQIRQRCEQNCRMRLLTVGTHGGRQSAYSSVEL